MNLTLDAEVRSVATPTTLCVVLRGRSYALPFCLRLSGIIPRDPDACRYFLFSLLSEKIVSVTIDGKLSCGTYSGFVTHGNQDVGLALIECGLADYDRGGIE